MIASLVLEAMTPAAIEASAALAANLEAERAALDRLVSRTLERAWEAALTEADRSSAVC